MPPKTQGLILGGVAVVGMLGAKIVAQEQLTIWQIAASMLLLFSIMNNGLSVFSPDYKRYVSHSMYIFMGLLIGLIALATVLSGLSIFETNGYRNIFIIILISNFIFISMVMMIKGLLMILAEKDKKL